LKKLLIVLLLFFSNNVSQFYFLSTTHGEILPKQESYKAVIDLTENGAMLDIVGKFYNETDSTIFIEYKMKTTKISKSGRTSSTQSGKDNSAPKSELILAKVGLNIDIEMRYSISLQIFEDGELIAEDLVNYNFE